MVPKGAAATWAGLGGHNGSPFFRETDLRDLEMAVALASCVRLFSCCTANMPEDYPDQFDDVMDFIEATIRRLKGHQINKWPCFLGESGTAGAAASPEGARGSALRGARGRNRGCVLTAVHLNVTDLGLGYKPRRNLYF